MNTKRLVIFIAPPGAGKGTQADVLSHTHGFEHVETAKIISHKFMAAEEDDAVIVREKEKYDAGQMVEPKLVSQWFLEEIELLSNQGKSIVVSGSPRTLYEAKAVLPSFIKWFGTDNIIVFNVEIDEETSIQRNSGRRLCKLNRHPIPNDEAHRNITVCPDDGSALEHRGSLDTPEVIKKRYQVYLEETKPVLDVMREMNLNIIEIDGSDAIETMSKKIASYIDGLKSQN